MESKVAVGVRAEQSLGQLSGHPLLQDYEMLKSHGMTPKSVTGL